MTKPTLYIGWTGHQCASTTHEACTDQHHAYRPASPGEILAAARPLADLKNDQVLDWMEVHLGRYDWQTALAVVEQLMDAALGADDD